MLLSVIDNLLELLDKLGVLLFFPGLVGSPDALLHLLERLLQHRREILMHRVNVKGKLFCFILFGLFEFLFFFYDFVLALLQGLDLLVVFIDLSLKFGLKFS